MPSGWVHKRHKYEDFLRPDDAEELARINAELTKLSLMKRKIVSRATHKRFVYRQAVKAGQIEGQTDGDKK